MVNVYQEIQAGGKSRSTEELTLAVDTQWNLDEWAQSSACIIILVRTIYCVLASMANYNIWLPPETTDCNCSEPSVEAVPYINYLLLTNSRPSSIRSLVMVYG